MPYRADHYYRFDEMTDLLRSWEDDHPERARLESIGTSPEGREIWVLAITDRSTGDFEDKPAFWIDGNTHASEVMGSAAALRTIELLLEGGEPECDELLKRVTFYVAPRINPDGAEYCLETHHYVRSARRIWPDPDPAPGLEPTDVDGDGEILQMRVEAEDGAWRVSERDPRVMIPRRPWDTKGPFYHLYDEGIFDEAAWRDPRHPVRPRDPHGLDFNRNYPINWKPDWEESGAGDYPLSEPETRAVVDFLLEHRNVGGIMSYHTFSGVLLRPFTDKADTEMPKFDLAIYERLGDRCKELTGFPCLSTFHDFRYDPKSTTAGVFDDWGYERYGVHTFTMELWCPWKHAGLDFSEDFLEFWRGRSEDDELALMAWNDGELEGEAFEDWRPFDHPQLGRIELGGWRFLFSFRNAPPKLLADEVEGSVRFTLDHARALPKPRLSLRCEGEGPVRTVIARLENHGHLPTYITELARDKGMLRKPHLELLADDGLELVRGEASRRVDHLGGLDNQTIPFFGSQAFGGRTRTHVAEYEWLVKGEGRVTARWRGDRIGRLESELVIGSS